MKPNHLIAASWMSDSLSFRMDEAGRAKWFVKSLAPHRDDRGTLIAIEAGIDVPFAIRRVYYLYGTAEDAERGFHAHRNLKQLAIAANGSCTFLLDDGRDEEEVRLDRPDIGLFIDSMVWREMRNFSNDCVLIVLASEPYDEADYIRDREIFVSEIKSLGAQ